MLSSQEEQRDRREVMRQDADLRKQQASTLHGFAQADAEVPRGRFTSVTAENVVGAEPTIKYPAAASPWQGPDLVGDEPPLSFDNPALEPAPAQATGEPTAPSPTPGDVEPVGSPLSSGGLTSAAPSTLPLGDVQRGVRPSTFRRFR
jgi:hypothetical protein